MDVISSPALSPPEVTQASPDDVSWAAQVLADAFQTDPHFDWFVRADSRRDAARLQLFQMLLHGQAQPQGRIDRIAGARATAVWMPSQVLAPSRLKDDVAMLPRVLPVSGLSRLPRLLRLMATMEKHHPFDIPHAYLWFLGVAPQLQGQGLGSALLKTGLARVDDAGISAWLETGTEQNVRLYTRYGFEVVHEGRLSRTGPVMWHMLRPARSIAESGFR